MTVPGAAGARLARIPPAPVRGAGPAFHPATGRQRCTARGGLRDPGRAGPTARHGAHFMSTTKGLPAR